jgi:hypothetical protein
LRSTTRRLLFEHLEESKPRGTGKLRGSMRTPVSNAIAAVPTTLAATVST